LSPVTKLLRWLGGAEIKTPPVGEKGRQSPGAANLVIGSGRKLQRVYATLAGEVR